MKLDDVLAAAGDHPLSGFDWGASAVILVNSLLPAEHHINIGFTGKEAYLKLRSAPSSTLMVILTREVRINGSSVEFVHTTPFHVPFEQPAMAGVPPTVPPPGPKRMSPIAMVVLAFLVAVGLMFTYSSIQTTRVTGEPQEHDTLKTIIDAMTDMVREEQGADPKNGT